MTTREEREAEQKRHRDAHIQRIVDAAPPLTPEQKDRLAALLRPAVTKQRQETRDDR